MSITLDGTNGITTPDLTSADAITAGGVTYPTQGSFGHRNKIINGDMRIDQRNAGASVPWVGSNYAVDRYHSYNSVATGSTGQQSTDVPSGAGFTNSIKYTVGTGGTSGTNGVAYFRQVIEGNNVADFQFGTSAAKTITLSFWAKSSITGTYGIGIRNTTRSYVAQYTISSANTWEQKTITVAGDTAGTWATDNTEGISIQFDMGLGTNFETTAGSWQTGAYMRASGNVRLSETSGATFYITGVQLEEGSVATPFEHRPYGYELALCQRYFQRNTRNAISPSSIGTNALVRVQWSFGIKMRASPTITYNDGNGNSGKIYRNGANRTGSFTPDVNGFTMQSTDTPANGFDDLFFNFDANAEL